MAKSKIVKERTAPARGLEAQLPRWTRMAKTVPAMRLDKIRGTRQAVENNSLESEDVLDITIERLSEDLGLADDNDDAEAVG